MTEKYEVLAQPIDVVSTKDKAASIFVGQRYSGQDIGANAAFIHWSNESLTDV
jgi:hypothetical protein